MPGLLQRNLVNFYRVLTFPMVGHNPKYPVGRGVGLARRAHLYPVNSMIPAVDSNRTDQLLTGCITSNGQILFSYKMKAAENEPVWLNIFIDILQFSNKYPNEALAGLWKVSGLCKIIFVNMKH